MFHALIAVRKSFTWINHWSHCTTDGGHAILLGFQYGARADYRYARQLRLEVTILGIGFEWKGPLAEPSKPDAPA